MYDSEGQLNVPHREWLVDFDRIVNEVRAIHPEDFVGARVLHALELYRTLSNTHTDYIYNDSTSFR